MMATLPDSSVRDGLLLINKPSGPTSYDVIRWIKRTLPKIKIGHCGTLDPLATGLLIILIGKATKKQSTIMGQDKTYACHMRLGVQTDTADIQGQVIGHHIVPDLSDVFVKNILNQFIGEQEQIPPMYSALKRNGVPLYKLARQGETVEREPRKITIHSIDLLGLPSRDEIHLRVRCTSGTYIRTLVEDVAKKMGTCATMSELTRENIGDFTLAEAIPGGDLKNFSAEQIWSHLQPVH